MSPTARPIFQQLVLVTTVRQSVMVCEMYKQVSTVVLYLVVLGTTGYQLLVTSSQQKLVIYYSNYSRLGRQKINFRVDKSHSCDLQQSHAVEMKLRVVDTTQEMLEEARDIAIMEPGKTARNITNEVFTTHNISILQRLLVKFLIRIIFYQVFKSTERKYSRCTTNYVSLAKLACSTRGKKPLAIGNKSYYLENF